MTTDRGENLIEIQTSARSAFEHVRAVRYGTASACYETEDDGRVVTVNISVRCERDVMPRPVKKMKFWQR